MNRRFDDANLWSGVWRHPRDIRYPGKLRPNVVPTLVVTLRLRYWSLPLTISVGGHLLSKPGVTIGVGPVYFSWSWL